jgi:hypothetical protein
MKKTVKLAILMLMLTIVVDAAPLLDKGESYFYEDFETFSMEGQDVQENEEHGKFLSAQGKGIKIAGIPKGFAKDFCIDFILRVPHDGAKRYSQIFAAEGAFKLYIQTYAEDTRCYKIAGVFYVGDKKYSIKTNEILDRNTYYYLAFNKPAGEDAQLYINGIALPHGNYNDYATVPAEIQEYKGTPSFGSFYGEIDDLRVGKARTSKELRVAAIKIGKQLGYEPYLPNKIGGKNAGGIIRTEKIVKKWDKKKPHPEAFVPFQQELVATYENISYYIPFEDVDATCDVFYRAKGNKNWKKAFEPFHDKKLFNFRGSIVGVNPNTVYEVKFDFAKNGKVVSTSKGEVRTWNENPVIAKDLNFADFYKTPGKALVLHENGTSNGWIRIKGDGQTIYDFGRDSGFSINISNCTYFILENVRINGGGVHGVVISDSSNVRLINCEITGFCQDGLQYLKEEKSDGYGSCMLGRRYINFNAGVKMSRSGQITIERCYIHDPVISANPWYYCHPHGPTAIMANTRGGEGNYVIRYNDLIGSDMLRWNDGIEGTDNWSCDGSFYRDSDIYGNMFAYGNDDSIEMDGGNMNNRFYKNRITRFVCGMSVAPTIMGPSYIYRNVFAMMGDENGKNYNALKAGGGYTYGMGYSYLFNNTVYNYGHAFGGGGFGRGVKRYFHAKTRNNLILVQKDSADTIHDTEKNPNNDFDYDLLWNEGLRTNKMIAAVGSEKNALIVKPMFENEKNRNLVLKEGSQGVDSALYLNNFSEGYLGKGADYGSIESGSSELSPYRPIKVKTDKYFIDLIDCSKNANKSEIVTLESEDTNPENQSFKIMRNSQDDWISVKPAKGKLIPGKKLKLKVSVDLDKAKLSEIREGMFLVRFASGYSIPIQVQAKIKGVTLDSLYEADELDNLAVENEVIADQTASKGKFVLLKGANSEYTRNEPSVSHNGFYYVYVKAKGFNGSTNGFVYVKVNKPRSKYKTKVDVTSEWKWYKLGLSYMQSKVHLLPDVKATNPNSFGIAGDPDNPVAVDQVMFTTNPWFAEEKNEN